MLNVLLNILSVIGLILLILLGVILTALLIILFVPIFYKVKAEKQEQINARVKINWLLGLVRAGYQYPTPNRFVIKLLIFTIYDSGKEKKVSKSKKKQAVNDAATVQEAPDSKHEKSESESTADKTENTEAKSTAQPEETKNGNTKNENKTKIPNGKNIKSKFQDIRNTLQQIRENTDYYKKLFEEKDTKELLAHVFKRFGRILKSICPRKLKANIIYGTGSPDTTGYIYAVYGIFSPQLGKNVIVEPNFEEPVLTGNLEASGRITIFKLLWNGLMVALDKKLWAFVSKIKRKEA